LFEDLINKIGVIIEGKYKMPIRVYGSFATQLYLPSSDIDIGIEISKSESFRYDVKFLLDLEKVLKNSDCKFIE